MGGKIHKELFHLLSTLTIKDKIMNELIVGIEYYNDKGMLTQACVSNMNDNVNWIEECPPKNKEHKHSYIIHRFGVDEEITEYKYVFTKPRY